jgi:hypothetical protein
MSDSTSEFEDWLGRPRDDPALCRPQSVGDALRYVFWRDGYLLGILVGNALIASMLLRTELVLVYAGIIAFLTLAVTLGSAVAFDESFLAVLSALAALVLVVTGLWWGTRILGVGITVSLLLALGIFGALICTHTREKMREFADERVDGN